MSPEEQGPSEWICLLLIVLFFFSLRASTSRKIIVRFCDCISVHGFSGQSLKPAYVDKACFLDSDFPCVYKICRFFKDFCLAERTGYFLPLWLIVFRARKDFFFLVIILPAVLSDAPLGLSCGGKI